MNSTNFYNKHHTFHKGEKHTAIFAFLIEKYICKRQLDIDNRLNCDLGYYQSKLTYNKKKHLGYYPPFPDAKHLVPVNQPQSISNTNINDVIR